MKTTSLGLGAETAVAEQLVGQGHEILARNWRLPICEIDLISRRKKIAYFTEVKFRASATQGSGFSYITPAKRRQIEFAARVWMQNHRHDGDWRLQAAEVSGVNYEQIEIIELE